MPPQERLSRENGAAIAQLWLNSADVALLWRRLRQNWPYDCGIIDFTRSSSALLSDQALHQLGEPQKIRHTDDPPTLPDHNLRIGGDHVGPVPRHRAHAILVDAQQEPLAITVVSLADANELLSAERMKRVRHAHKMRCRVGKACTLT